MSIKQKIAIVSVINDLVTDRRVDKTCMLLTEEGYKVILVGRKKKDSLDLSKKPYEMKRFRLIFESGIIFYLEYNLRLLFFLLAKKKHLLWSNDLDTLLPNFICSKLQQIELIYDSHEIFCEVPELKNAPIKKKIWEALESFTLPKIKFRITVNESIAQWFRTRYTTDFLVVRNINSIPRNLILKSRAELDLPENKNIILLQGAGINIDRGAEELVDAMAYLDGIQLVIIGGGDVIELLKQKSVSKALEDKITFLPKLKPEELMHYTKCADLGISIDKNTNLNYEYSLPNKLFDYIHAGIPILASRLIEIEKIIKQYEIGYFIDEHNPMHIAQRIQECLLHPDYLKWKQNTKLAAEALNWEQEKQKLQQLIQSVKI